MSLFRFFSRRASAPVARERLQILLAHERAAKGESELVLKLREDILKVIAKHLKVEPDCVQVRMQSEDAISTLTVDVEIPDEAEQLLAKAS